MQRGRESELTSTTFTSSTRLAYSDSPDVIEDDDSLQAPEIVPGLNKCKSSDNYDTWVVPIEVSVIEDEAGHGAFDTVEGTRVVSQAEAREFLQQIEYTQKLVDQRTMDLNRSRLQVAELIKQNSRLLRELKAACGQDEATTEEQRMVRQELNMLKVCLFLGTLWIWCGGRADVIGIVAFVWMMADVSS